MTRTLAAALLLLCLAGAPRFAQSATPVPNVGTPSKALVLIPYQEPGSTDPHALAISKTLLADFATAGIVVKDVPAVEHMDAVANAAKICAENDAAGLLVPEGRYEQTLKQLSIALFVTLLKYPTHAEFRLDRVSCDGVIEWSTTTTGDQTPSGVDSVGNLGAAVDAAFSSAEQNAVHAFAMAPPAPIPGVGLVRTPVSAVTAPVPVSTYLLIPFEQPGVADPRAADITHSLLGQLQLRKLDLKVAAPLDHLSVISGAQQLCAANGAQAIIVPNVRVEQSSFTGRSHASLHLALMNCAGGVLGHGSAEADMGNGSMNNFGAAVVGVSERAMGPAIDQLFPNVPR